MNKGTGKGDKTATGDERYTPYYAVESILHLLPRDKIYWCPFDEYWSAFPYVLEKNGFKVVRSCIQDGDHFDFFKYQPKEWDIIISNPPFSFKEKIFERLEELGKPYLLLLPMSVLEAQRYYRYFDELQLILFDARVCYFTPDDFFKPQTEIAFGSLYLGKGVLEKDLNVCHLERNSEPLSGNSYRDPEDTEYCVIIGKEIPGGCDVTFCNGLDDCPYFNPN